MSTTLYRIYDDDSELLYIGIAGNLGRRLEQHADEKPWWPGASVVAIEHYSTRAEACLLYTSRCV